MGKVQIFTVVFDRTAFNAGTAVTGKVVIQLSEATKAKCIKIQFHGKAKVHWSKTRHSGNSTNTTHYRQQENYFDQTFLLWQSENESKHPAGRHEYPFQFSLASSFPSSFEGVHGNIRYFCKAFIIRPWKSNHESKHAFTVINPLDLNSEPELQTAVQGNRRTEVSCCCCVSGHVTANVRVDKRGYVPGEVVAVQAEIVNNSNTVVEACKLTLTQNTTFYGTSDALFSSGRLKEKRHSQVVAVANKGQIPANQTQIWASEGFRIPPVPPSRLVGCGIISVSYELTFQVEPNWGKNMKIGCDVVIGTVPFHAPQVALGADSPPSYEFAVNVAPTTPPVPITTQPVPLPSAPAFPSAPVMTAEATAPYEIAPPSYEECVFGRVFIKDDDDNDQTMGQLDFAPVYPTYRRNGPGLRQALAGITEQPTSSNEASTSNNRI